LLEDLGVEVVALPFELHPEIPSSGISLRERWGPRFEAAMRMYDRVAAECDAAGLPFGRPERIPNTRRALQTAEYVRVTTPDAFPTLDRSLYTAHFVDGAFIGDPAVLDELVDNAGADATAVREAVERGDATDDLRASMEAARDVGVTGTPSWLLDGRLLLPGLQPRETVAQLVDRLRERPSGPLPEIGRFMSPDDQN
jgi:predicted DsbA family dithiol-disulfide isomerase